MSSANVNGLEKEEDLETDNETIDIPEEIDEFLT